jgi:carbonic anhydrase/acetyltransferase-like protein (isoleucine patch superfamily)
MIKNFIHTPQIGANTYIDDTALIVGNVSIGENCSIWPMVVIRGDIHRIEIGNRTNIQDGTIIHVTHAGDFNPEGFPTILGDDIIVGHRVILHGCTIHSNSLIGMGSIVMDGAVVHSDVILGAGSIVPPGKELASGHLWVGSPVRMVREITEKEYAFLRYSADYYVQLKDKYLSNTKEI